VAVRARLLLPIVIAGLLAACGGASSEPQTASVAPPPPATGENAVTVSPLEESTGTATDEGVDASAPVFPAESPSDVLALAAQHPNGRVLYATILDGRQGELVLAREGDKGLVAVTGDEATVRVGVNLVDSSIRWVCVSRPGDPATCKQRDFKSYGANALAVAAQLVGEDAARQIASRIANTSDGALAVQTRANAVDASCLTGTDADGSALMVCVSPSGFITDTQQSGTIAQADQVSPTVDPKELEPSDIG
jgi:hypothetical protein